MPVFQERSAPLRVERRTLTGNITEKVVTAFASGTAPDVFTAGSTNVVSYADPGWLLPLDGHRGLKQHLADFFEPPRR